MSSSVAARRPVVFSPLTVVGFGLAMLLLGWVHYSGVHLPRPLLIGVIGGAGATLFIAGLLKPELPLLALAVYLPFSKVLPGDFGGFLPGFNLTNILTAITIIGFIVQHMMRGRQLIERNALNAPIALFCLLGAISLMYGAWLDIGGWSAGVFAAPLKRWLTPILLFYLVYNLVTDRVGLQRMTIVIMVMVAAVALLADRQYASIADAATFEKSRVGGIAKQPNMLGAFFVYYMFLFAASWLVGWPKGKGWLMLIPFLFCLRGLHVTFSRGAYIAFAAGALALAWFRNKAFACLVGLVLLVVAANPALLPGNIAERMQSTVYQGDQYHSLDEDALTRRLRLEEEQLRREQLAEAPELVGSLDLSSARRVEVWGATLKMIADRPFGVGYGMFPQAIGYYAPGARLIDAHNSYLLIAAEMGIPTLLVFLWILGVVFRRSHRLYRATNDPFFKALSLGWLAGLWGLLVANMFGSRLHSAEISSYFWILCGLIMRAYAIERNTQLAGRALTVARARA